jgi:hypothetical protein
MPAWAKKREGISVWKKIFEGGFFDFLCPEKQCGGQKAFI